MRRRHMRNTKIVATLGPASNDVETIKRLIEAGVSVARINFSHGTYESHGEIIAKLKEAREALKKPVALMLDTKGPEIRIKTFKDGSAAIEQGQKFTLTTRDIVGDETIVAVTYDGLPKDVKPGGRILIDDGLVEFKVVGIEGTEIECSAVNAGVLGNRKGINVPDVYVNLPSITERDIEDIKFGITQGFDYIAASFVRSPKDVLAIRRVLEDGGGSHIHIIAKIESRDGVDNLDSILEVADGIMVARGDLGVEIPPEEVPLVQKQLIHKANAAGKPVITATQMLESMVHNPRPTRAEANDVANAIFDGSDAIMLSGETAQGAYPVESVTMMARIAGKAESSVNYRSALSLNQHHIMGAANVTNAISYSTCTTAADLNAACIVTVTNSGFTARMVSKYKPHCPLVAVALNDVVWRQMALVWGCVPVRGLDHVGDGEIFKVASKEAVNAGFAKTGDYIVIVAGVPVGIAGSTNMIKVQIVGDILAKGRGVGEGVIAGRTAVVKVPEDAERVFRNGDVLVTTYTDDRLMKFIRKACAVVIGSDKKIDTFHAETACKALQIPLVICDDRVIDLIPMDVGVTIDVANGFVYNGAMEP
jgi:pyruvate kinase